MELGDYLAVIDAEGVRMISVAEEAGLETNVPTCPTWNVGKLLLHTGEVHRWATAVVAGRHTSLANVPEDYLGVLPEPNDTITWFGRGVTVLRDTLASADQTVTYDAFLKDPPTPRLLFWARRQAMEISMHRLDAESALGRCTPFDPVVAADGIDEFLTGFITRGKGYVRMETARTIGVSPTDVANRWTVTISDGPIVTDRSSGEVDCSVSGTASDIYLALWNRGSLDALTIDGDRSLIDALRENVRIRWS